MTAPWEVIELYGKQRHPFEKQGCGGQAYQKTSGYGFLLVLIARR
jgi:hypothetical protein